MEKMSQSHNAENSNEKMNLINHLRFLNDSFSSEVPENILHSTSPNNRFKVRKNWFQGLIADFEHAIEYLNPQKDSDLKNEINNFLNDYAKPEFTNRLTTSEDIRKADDLLNKVMSALEENL